MDNASDRPLNETATESALENGPWPRWLLVLAGFTVLCMATQLTLLQRLPLTAADLFLGLSLVGILFVMWRRRAQLPLARSILLFLLLCCLAALAAGSGRPGALEIVQRTEQFLAAYLLFQLLLDRRPGWLVSLVGVGLAVNVVTALAQAAHHGLGPQVTGLFRSRTALDYFLIISLAWLLPYWLTAARGLVRVLILVAAVALCLGVMANGQVLLLAVTVLSFAALCHSRRGFVLTVGAATLFLLSLWIGPAPGARRAILAETLSPFHGDRLKQCHTELVAAMRMSADHPLTGAGLGRYQQWIGTYYRELYNPNENQIETDTQSGYGILFGSSGMLAGTLFVLILLAAVVRGLRNWFGTDARDPTALAGAAGTLAVLAGMWVSDPLVRGVAWYAVLALAAAHRPRGGERSVGHVLGWKGVVVWGALFALLAARTAFGPDRGTGGLGKPAAVVGLPPIAPSQTAPPAATSNAGGSAEFAPDQSFFKVVDASEAKEFTPPVVKDKDPRAAEGTILRIPDDTGKPPEGADPDMKFGGMRFEVDIPRNMTCAVWMRVFWEGSCGNSIYYRHTDGTTLAVGNDGTYDIWHWLKVPKSFRFKKGRNTFYVLNREDGVRLDQIVITGDLEYVPQGIEEE
ncbi:MAG: hypothetical protein GXP31_13405 [Kiritimatiellaeota bacterium]|nr:hypothetical protein [Kiritimatiellota bacterium]